MPIRSAAAAQFQDATASEARDQIGVLRCQSLPVDHVQRLAGGNCPDRRRRFRNRGNEGAGQKRAKSLETGRGEQGGVATGSRASAATSKDCGLGVDVVVSPTNRLERSH